MIAKLRRNEAGVQRADAVRNRARLLVAAETLFATHGLDATVEEVAKRAGVGVGTLFRHFPTKDALVAAVLDAMHDSLMQHLQVAADVSDPRSALYDLCLRLSAFQARHRALAEAMAHNHPLETARAGRAQIYGTITEIVGRGQEAGCFRPDIVAADVAVLVAGISQAALIEDTASLLRERYITIVIDGLNPATATILPGPAPGPEAIRHLREDRAADEAPQGPAS